MLWGLLCWCGSAGLAHAADDNAMVVEIAEPYLELHVGPGKSYPIFYVVERGDKVAIIKRRTDWYKVRTGKHKEGWAPRSDIEKTLTASGLKLRIKDTTQESFFSRHWEAGILGGGFEGSDAITLYTGYAFNPYLSTEVSLSQILGGFSDSLMMNLDVVAQPFNDWPVSPFFTLGTGVIDTHARKTVVEARDSTDQVSHAGVGFRVYLGRRFIFRAEYRNHVIFTQTDDNKEIDEWRAGFAFFY